MDEYEQADEDRIDKERQEAMDRCEEHNTYEDPNVYPKPDLDDR